MDTEKTTSIKIKKRKNKRVVLSSVNRITGRVYRAIGNGAVARYMTNYNESCEHFERSYFYRLFAMIKHKRRLSSGYYVKQESFEAGADPKEFEGVGFYSETTVSRTWRNRFSSWFESSWSVNLLKSIKDSILYTPLVSYGVMIFAFALFMLISQALMLVFSSSGVVIPFLTHIGTADTVLTVTYMAAAVVLMTTALLMVFAKDGSLIAFLLEGKISGFFLRSFMGVRYHSPENLRARHNGRSFAVGVILGLITFFIPPVRFFGILGVLVFSSIVICIPEFGLVSLIFVFPFFSVGEAPTVRTVLLVALVLLSCVLKILRGKRYIRFEPIDLLVTAFLILLFLGGVVTMGGKSSFASALVMTVLALVYFVATLLIKGEDWLNRCINAFLLSASLVSSLGILEWVLGLQQDIWQDKTVFAQLSGRIVSLWENPNVFAEYLLVAIFVSLGCLISRKGVGVKTGAMLTLALSSVCLALTWSRGAWLAAIVVFVFFFLAYSHKSVPWIGLAIVGVGASAFFMPDVVIERFVSVFTLSDSSIQYRINIWKGCSKLLRNCFLTGVGVGESAFSEAYDGYALIGIETAPHAHSLFLQILIELGVMGLFVFLTLVLTSLRASFSTFRAQSFKNAISVSNLALTSAMITLLLNGFTDYVWYNYRIFMLFFLVLGMIIASARIGMRSTVGMMQNSDVYDVEYDFDEKKRKTKSTKKKKD